MSDKDEPKTTITKLREVKIKPTPVGKEALKLARWLEKNNAKLADFIFIYRPKGDVELRLHPAGTEKGSRTFFLRQALIKALNRGVAMKPEKKKAAGVLRIDGRKKER